MIQSIPQIWKSWHEKSTEGLSSFIGFVFKLHFELMIHLADVLSRLLWGISGAFLGVYVIVQDLNVPLIVQPQVLSVLSLISWSQVKSALWFELTVRRISLTVLCLSSASTTTRSDRSVNALFGL